MIDDVRLHTCDTRRAFANESAILDADSDRARERKDEARSGAEWNRAGAGFSARSAEESIDGEGMVCDAIARHRVRSPYLYPTRHSRVDSNDVFRCRASASRVRATEARKSGNSLSSIAPRENCLIDRKC